MYQTCQTSSGGHLDALSAIVGPPIVFLIGCGFVGLVNLYAWATGGSRTGDWSDVILVGCMVSGIGLVVATDGAVPKSIGDLRIFTVSTLSYSVVVGWLLTMASMVDPSPLPRTLPWLVPIGLITATLMGCIRTVGRTRQSAQKSDLSASPSIAEA